MKTSSVDVASRSSHGCSESRISKPSFDEAPRDAMDDAVEELFQLFRFRDVRAMKSRAVVVQRVDPVQDDHVQMNIEIERAAEPPDQQAFCPPMVGFGHLVALGTDDYPRWWRLKS